MLNNKVLSDHLKLPSPLTPINSTIFSEKNINLQFKRDDLIHPEISGNKWRKLYLNILEAKKQNKNTILTFGGPFSNHIYASAAAAKIFDLKSIGIIRGEYVDENNSTLKFAEAQGMEIVRISKVIYGSHKESIAMQYPKAYTIPEGGNNELGRMGMKYLAEELNLATTEETLLVLPIGTGCTMAGLVQHLNKNFSVLGINVLKNKSIDVEIYDLTKNSKLNYEINHSYHFGGYAKTTKELIDFSNKFAFEQGVNLDPIYTAKSMYAIYDLATKNRFPQDSKIIALHTGGLQGIIPYNRLNTNQINLVK